MVLGKRNWLGQLLPAQHRKDISLSPSSPLPKLIPSDGEKPSQQQVRIPTVTRYLPAIHQNLSIPKSPETFKSDFLHLHLFGDRVSQTLYWSDWKDKRSPYKGNPHTAPNHGYIIDAYHIVKSEHEPFMPAAPGHHGAKLSPFVHQHDYDDVPRDDVALFVSDANGKSVYYGQYRQPRQPDLLDYDRLVEEVPITVKRYWAHKLGTLDHSSELTKWLRESVKSYLCETHYPRFKIEEEEDYDMRVQSPRREPHDAEEELEFRQELDNAIRDMDEDKIMEFYRDVSRPNPERDCLSDGTAAR